MSKLIRLDSTFFKNILLFLFSFLYISWLSAFVIPLDFNEFFKVSFPLTKINFETKDLLSQRFFLNELFETTFQSPVNFIALKTFSFLLILGLLQTYIYKKTKDLFALVLFTILFLGDTQLIIGVSRFNNTFIFIGLVLLGTIILFFQNYSAKDKTIFYLRSVALGCVLGTAFFLRINSLFILFLFLFYLYQKPQKDKTQKSREFFIVFFIILTFVSFRLLEEEQISIKSLSIFFNPIFYKKFLLFFEGFIVWVSNYGGLFPSYFSLICVLLGVMGIQKINKIKGISPDLKNELNLLNFLIFLFVILYLENKFFNHGFTKGELQIIANLFIVLTLGYSKNQNLLPKEAMYFIYSGLIVVILYGAYMFSVIGSKWDKYVTLEEVYRFEKNIKLNLDNKTIVCDPFNLLRISKKENICNDLLLNDNGQMKINEIKFKEIFDNQGEPKIELAIYDQTLKELLMKERKLELLVGNGKSLLPVFYKNLTFLFSKKTNNFPKLKNSISLVEN